MEIGRGPRQTVRIDGAHGGRQRIVDASGLRGPLDDGAVVRRVSDEDPKQLNGDRNRVTRCVSRDFKRRLNVN